MAEPIFELAGKRVWVAGHRGMVGSALMRRLAREDCELVTADRRSVDLTRQTAVENWIQRERPQVVFLAAAKVGGILANSTLPGTFLYDNLLIAANVIEAARRTGVEKLVFLGSTCIYPREAPQPIREEALLTGPLEPTNEWYAVAKIAGIKLCQAYRRQYGCDFIAAQPTNLYGPGDNYDPAGSHVAAALIRKAHEAKSAGRRVMTIWGSGSPRREFLHVDDLADALVFLVRHYCGEEIVNIGSGEEVTILELAHMICGIVGFHGEIKLDRARPDGMPRKLCDGSKLRTLGWSGARGLGDGLADAYAHYLKTEAARRVPVAAGAPAI